jgi:recombination protein RecA
MPKGKVSASLDSVWKTYEDYLEPGNKDQSHRMRFPSGIFGLDTAIGSLGLGRGIVEILGGEAVGKTTLALTILAETQRTGKLVEIQAPDGKSYNAVYMDFEHSYDNVYAATLGVDTEKLLVLNMMYAQDQFQIVEFFLEAGIQFVIIDSISVLIPKSEEEKDLDDNEKMADEAKILSRVMKRMNALSSYADAIIVAINQYRANMSPMAHTEKKGYGAWVLRYLKKVTIELTRIERKDTRMTIQAFVQKNKMGAIGKKITYEIEHGKGIDINQHILNLALEHDIVEKSGKVWWYYPSIQNPQYKGQGEANAVINFPMAEIKQKVLEVLSNE